MPEMAAAVGLWQPAHVVLVAVALLAALFAFVRHVTVDAAAGAGLAQERKWRAVALVAKELERDTGFKVDLEAGRRRDAQSRVGRLDADEALTPAGVILARMGKTWPWRG